MFETNESGVEVAEGAGVPGQPARSETPKATGGSKAVLRRGGGPRTPEGKKVVSRNAIKHGITSASPVAGGESQENWEEFLEGVAEDCNSLGVIGQTLEVLLASAFWRKFRVMNFEAAIIDARIGVFESRARGNSSPKAEDKMLDELGCDLADAVALLEALDQLDDSLAIEEKEVSNALFVPAIVCTDQRLPDWLVFPQPGQGWTPADIWRWLTAFAEHLGTTGYDIRRDAVAKGLEILNDRRQRQAAQERASALALFSNQSEIELIQRYETRLDRMIDSTIRQIEILHRAKAGQLSPPSRIQVSLE